MVTDRDLEILQAVLRYRFIATSELVRVVGGNEDVTQRRLRYLWEQGLVSRFAFPGIRTHSEFHYYFDNRRALDLLATRRLLDIHPLMIQEIKHNREKDYAGATLSGQHMQLGFLQHSLMISRFHFMLEQACKRPNSGAELVTFRQGSSVGGHKVDVPRVISSRRGNDYLWQETGEVVRLPVEPDALFTLRFGNRLAGEQCAHFVYEADRGTMVATDMLRKFRAYYHFIKRQQRHKTAFGVHPVRAVLIETTDEARAKRLMELVHHPLVAGPNNRAGLFWLTISPLFTDFPEHANGSSPGSKRYLSEPEAVFERIWALPDRTMLALADMENSPPSSTVTVPGPLGRR
ncbi:MAG TPA: replication-relaxation family protein [Bryobacteraceae bacterium]|nr:replication-relaxation family protein [Bryobacteraceae bacterium]